MRLRRYLCGIMPYHSQEGWELSIAVAIQVSEEKITLDGVDIKNGYMKA